MKKSVKPVKKLRPFKLTSPLSRFFGTVKPMEPQSRNEPFDDPDYYYQVKWDGVRILAFIENGRVRLQNRKGHCRSAQYPELQRLSEICKPDALLDGEVVVMESGRPNFARVIQRDLSRKKQAISALMKKAPCTYCVFDLLYLDGTDLTGLPLAERLQILSDLIKVSPPVYLNDNFTSGISLYSLVKEQQLEGIVAKKKNSPYELGEKSKYWLKIKPRRRLLAVIGGVVLKEGFVRSLLLGAYQDGRLLYIGRAGSGLNNQDARLLSDYAAHYVSSRPYFVNPPRTGGYTWLVPRLTVLVEYAEWTAGLSLRAPTIIGFSSRPPEEAEL